MAPLRRETNLELQTVKDVSILLFCIVVGLDYGNGRSCSECTFFCDGGCITLLTLVLVLICLIQDLGPPPLSIVSISTPTPGS